MYKKIIEKIKPELEKAIEYLKKEMSKIRTGRASPSLVEDIIVDCFEQKFPLKQLGAISAPDPRTIIIQPWDKSYLEPIEKAVSSSSLGFSAIVDKDIIRINIPPLNEEYRKNLLKIISEKKEDVHQTIRHFREKAWQEIQDAFKEKLIREDDKFRAKDELQDLIDEYNEKIVQITEKKKEEITNNN